MTVHGGAIMMTVQTKTLMQPYVHIYIYKHVSMCERDALSRSMLFHTRTRIDNHKDTRIQAHTCVSNITTMHTTVQSGIMHQAYKDTIVYLYITIINIYSYTTIQSYNRTIVHVCVNI